MTDQLDDLDGLEEMEKTSTPSTGSESTRERYMSVEPEDKGFAVVDKRGRDKEKEAPALPDISFKQAHEKDMLSSMARCPACKKKEIGVNFLSSPKLGDVIICIHCGNAFIPIERVRDIWTSVQQRHLKKG